MVNWDIASPSLSRYRDEIRKLQQTLDYDKIVGSDLPFGAYIVYGKEENTRKMASLLREAGCPIVEVQQVNLVYSREEAAGADVIRNEYGIWILKQRTPEKKRTSTQETKGTASHS